MEKPSNTKFFSRVVGLLQSARNNAVRAINQTMVLSYFEIGRLIVEEEQSGKERAAYGENLIRGLSKTLTLEFGKGFSVTNIKQMRQFYLIYSKGQTLSDLLKILPSKVESAIGQTASDQLKNAFAD